MVVTRLAPIPYVFRACDAGCVVHTGARVALNAAGIFPFAPTAAAIRTRCLMLCFTAEKKAGPTCDPLFR